jgi:hypothetical protein
MDNKLLQGAVLSARGLVLLFFLCAVVYTLSIILLYKTNEFT